MSIENSGSDAGHAESRTATAVSLSLIAGLWFVFFWPVLFGGYQFGFRDTTNLYFPLFEWISRNQEAGSLPPWNPLDDFGTPVVGDASSSLFYPGKLMFWLRLLSFDTRFAWYVAGHVLMAAFAARFAARSIGCSQAGATLAAISYAFGGAVVFQTCNVIYLVGAAWLPVAAGFAWNWCRKRRLASLSGASAALALMVLGGDPQMAYVAALIVAFLILTSNGEMSLVRRVGAAVFVTAFAIALSAIQVVPSARWTARSERTSIDPPVNVYAAISDGNFRGLSAEPISGSHASAIYEFSFAPWRVVEGLWPNVFGQFDFVSESNWASGLPGSDRLWTPTIYFGVVTCLLAAGQLRWRRDARPFGRTRWQLSWLGLWFLLASFGWYGVGWLVNELQLMRGGSGYGAEVGRSVGGLYWMKVALLPGFSAFRYPCKLIVIAALMACLLGGVGLDRMSADWNAKRRSLKCGALWTLAGSALLAVAMLMPDIRGAIGEDWSTTLRAAIHTTLVMLLVVTVLIGTQSSSVVQQSVVLSSVVRKSAAGVRLLKSLKIRRWTIVGLTAFDLVVANQGLSGFAPREPIEFEIGKPMTSVYRGEQVDRRAAIGATPLSLAELQRMDRASLRPRYHLAAGIRAVGSFTSIEPLDLLEWKSELRRLDEEQRNTVLASCGVQQVIEAVSLVGKGPLDAEISSRSVDGVPRFLLAYTWRVLPVIEERNPQAVRARTREMMDATVAKGSRHVVIESSEWPAASGNFVAADSVVPEFPNQVVVLRVEPSRIVLEVNASRECLLVCCDYFDPDWRATIEHENGNRDLPPVLRANRVLRAVPLPAGRSRVTLAYFPRGLISGSVASAFAWSIWLAIGLRAFARIARADVEKAARFSGKRQRLA